MTIVHKPSIIIEELGELGILPNGGIINAGGVVGSSFTVGGKEVVVQENGVGGGAVVVGVEHVQGTPSTLWTIIHNKNTVRVQSSVWDSTNEMVLPDIMKIVDPNTVTISFNTSLAGRAILMLF